MKNANKSFTNQASIKQIEKRIAATYKANQVESEQNTPQPGLD